MASEIVPNPFNLEIEVSEINTFKSLFLTDTLCLCSLEVLQDGDSEMCVVSNKLGR